MDDAPTGHIFTPYQRHLEQKMEKETSTALSEESLARRIAEIEQAIRSADPAELEEIERIKGIIRKNVSIFRRVEIAAYFLMKSSRTPAREERRERKPRPERQERKERTERSAEDGEKREAKPERVIPEGAKTLYLNIGKMKHLYAKDLSKLLQAELGITRDDIYLIRVHDKYSFVTMSEENCNKAIEKLNNQEINGRTAKVTYSEK